MKALTHEQAKQKAAEYLGIKNQYLNDIDTCDDGSFIFSYQDYYVFVDETGVMELKIEETEETLSF